MQQKQLPFLKASTAIPHLEGKHDLLQSLARLLRRNSGDLSLKLDALGQFASAANRRLSRIVINVARGDELTLLDQYLTLYIRPRLLHMELDVVVPAVNSLKHACNVIVIREKANKLVKQEFNQKNTKLDCHS